MGCTRFQRLAALNRIGELSEREEALLAAHLRHCPSCAAHAASMERFRSVVGLARDVHFDHADPEALTNSILERVARERTPRPHSTIGTLVDRVLDLAVQPVFRLASACVLLVAVSSFFWQSFAVIRDVRQLEAQQTDGSPAVLLVPQIGYAVDTRVLDAVRDTDLLRYPDVRPDGDGIIISGRALAFIREAEASAHANTFMKGRSLVRQNIHVATSEGVRIRSGIRPVLRFTTAQGV